MKSLRKFLPNWLVDQFNLPSKKTPWWIEIQTKIPHCTYYFGPFDSLKEAQGHQPGYIEDLVEEKAQGISVKIKQNKPTLLTICEE